MGLTRFAINRPTIIAMATIALMVFGIVSYLSLGRNLFPNVAFPVVVVSAGYPGASPAEMEKLVVKPIEDQLDGIENLDKLNAVTQEGTAAVIVQFKLDTNLDLAAQTVQQRVDAARINMPADLDPPFVDKNNAASDPIIEEVLSSSTLSGPALGDLVTDRIVPDIKAIPGVQGVDVRGEPRREIQVYPDNGRMLAANATLSDVFTTLSRNNANLPGGRLDMPNSETSVSVHADIINASDILGLPLSIPGGAQSNLHIGDVASVIDGHVEQRRASHYNGEPTVILDIQRQVTSDTVKTTGIARAALINIAHKYPQVHFKELEASADYTMASINGVIQSLLEGILLTAIVMLLFLHAWRNAAVVMVAIPTSLVATFIVMHALNFTVDIISMMGLGLTIGILVDDSIVVLENITRHRDLGEDPNAAAITGRTEIGGAAIAITLVDVVVFLPIAFLSGIVGKFMKEFGIVIVVATLFSLLVSFTLTPLLAARWSVKRRSTAPPKFLAWFQVGFERLLMWYHTKALPFALTHGWFIGFACAMLVVNALTLAAGPRNGMMLDAAVAGALLVWFIAAFFLGWRLAPHRTGVHRNGDAVSVNGSPSAGRLASMMYRLRGWIGGSRGRWEISLATIGVPLALMLLLSMAHQIGGEFIPNTPVGVVRLTVDYPQGTPLEVTQRGVSRLEREILKIGGVENVISTTGVKPSGFGSTVGGNVARLTVMTYKDRRKEQEPITDKIRTLGWTLPGGKLTAAGESGGGGGDPISYTLSGPDSQLQAGANKLAKFIRALPGTVNVQTSTENAAPRLNVHINPQRAAIVGVSPGDAATAARIAIGGAVATKVRTQSGLIDVRLQLPPGDRHSVSDVSNVLVRANSGMMVPLARVADFAMTKAPTKIERQNRERVIQISGGLDTNSKISLGEITSKIKTALATPGFLPSGTSTTSAGDSQLQEETFSSMGFALMTSFVLVYMLMVVLYGSFLEPFIIMFAVPVALVGALFGLEVRGQTLNLFSLIGIVMLFGLVAKNGILLVDYANTLTKRGMKVHEALHEAAKIRFRPIIMTTCAMVFGMLPLSLGITEGAEERASMGTVLIGGLLSSLILTLFLVPMVYNTWMGALERRAARKAQRVAAIEVREPVAVT
ncbi:MAG: efflux RND transporter permease subunit [Candidatus Eremiobacteraeota bacterium]|nr:efflux RND transporter permease subunit [Candidatus Eremiobacteraeota bacterium]